MRKINSWLMSAALGALLWAPAGRAMNLNLATPWGESCSPPQNPYVSFSAPGRSETMMFDGGDTIDFRVQAGLHALKLKWSLHRNLLQKPFLEGTVEGEPGYLFRIPIPTDRLLPGFYDLRVELDTGVPANRERDRLARRPVTGVCTFGWKIDELPLAETRPADFREFWDRARAEVAAIPLDARDESEKTVFDREALNRYNLEHASLPADYDPEGHKFETVESWKVSFAGPDGGRVYGWLAKPQGPGPFPAMLILPGGGFNARPRPLEHARHGYVALDMQVHGQDVDLPGKYPQFPGYYSDEVYEPVSANYFYRIHQRILQAINYLASRPDVDPTKIVLVGGSQGGRTGIVAAGLDDRVAAVVSTIPHFGNQPYLDWAAECNRIKSDGMDCTGAPPVPDTPRTRCLAYYDPMNFAPDIQCPILYAAGTVDPISPPYSTYAVYRRTGANREPERNWYNPFSWFRSSPVDKELVWFPGLGHDWSSAFDRRAWRWLDERLQR